MVKGGLGFLVSGLGATRHRWELVCGWVSEALHFYQLPVVPFGKNVLPWTAPSSLLAPHARARALDLAWPGLAPRAFELACQSLGLRTGKCCLMGQLGAATMLLCHVPFRLDGFLQSSSPVFYR